MAAGRVARTVAQRETMTAGRWAVQLVPRWVVTKVDR